MNMTMFMIYFALLLIHPEQFYCPCHFGRFDKQGNNIQGTPPTRPLDAYEVVVEDGKVKLGSIYQRQGGA